jgi:hypothetical protein
VLRHRSEPPPAINDRNNEKERREKERERHFGDAMEGVGSEPEPNRCRAHTTNKQRHGPLV